MSMLMEISDPQPISYSLLLLPLQSPPPAMSSSAALFFPRSEVSSAAAAGAAGSRQHADLYAVESERDEFAFLESKPSLMDERSAKGQGKAAKGRRHAGEAVLRRKLANQAFLVKIGGGGAAGCGAGKESGGSSKSGGGNGRRRGRVLSELVADQFAPSVPYSLNRKSRWARDGAGWLSDLVDGWSGQQRLRLCLSEADYSLAGTESVRALHRLDTSGGRLQSRWAKSGRGALLADLLAKSEEEAAEQENEEPTEEMHFQLSRPHMVSRVFAGKFFKRKQAVRCNKRAPIEMISSGPASGPALPRPTASVTESEPEEENEFLAQYRPRRETYSLADFVKDAPPTPPVMVRRPAAASNGRRAAAGRADSFEHFAFVPELEFMAMPEEGEEEEADEENSANASDSRPCPILCGLHQRLGSTTADCGFFRRFPGQGGDQTQLQALAAARPEWHPQWLGQQLLGLDLSWALTADGGSGRQQEPDSQMLLLVFDADELLVNSLIPLDGQKVAASLETNGLEQKVEALLAAIRSDFAEWTLANQQKRQQREAAQLEPLRSIYHSGRMALGLQPLSIHSLLAQQRAELGQEEGQFVSGEELLKQEQKPAEDEGHVEEEAEEEEEFELIDMGELLLQPNGGCSASSAAQCSPKMSAPKCADCSTSTAPLAMLRSCGHRLCRQCLGRALGRQMTAQETAATLRCPVCPAQVPLDLLPWLVALPVANTLVLLHHAQQQQQQQQKCQTNKQQFGQCPGCLGLLQCPTTGGPEFGQLCCLRCSLHWCPGCGLAPHWPLDCAQNAEWARRSRPTEEADADQPSQQKSVKCQQVSGQFAEVCAEARTRRLDARLGWQLGKHMRRLGDSRAERRFGAARKTALHLLEFGTVLLYLNRQQRSPAWSQLKSLLSALRDRVECLDSELLFSGSLTDPTGLRAKLADLEQLSEKCLAKLAAANAGKVEEKLKQQQQQQ